MINRKQKFLGGSSYGTGVLQILPAFVENLRDAMSHSKSDLVQWGTFEQHSGKTGPLLRRCYELEVCVPPKCCFLVSKWDVGEWSAPQQARVVVVVMSLM